MTDDNNRERFPLEESQPSLLSRYGELMTKEQAARELMFNSPTALRMARRRGAISLSAIKLPGRKQDFYRTREVVAVLASWLDIVKENTM